MAHTFVMLMNLIFMASFPFLLTLHGDFVFDDSEAIIRNKDVFSESWTDCFSNDFWGTPIKSNLSHKSYRPLTILTFRLNYFLNSKEFSAFSFKVTNLVCHVLCTVLVWLTYRCIMKSPQVASNWLDISYLGALIFAVHPIHVEAVSGIVGRADLMCGISFYLAFLCYHKAIYSKQFSYLFLFISILLSASSMLFKENGITVLGFCLFYDVVDKIFKKKKDMSKICNASHIIRFSLTLLSILLLLYARWAVMDGTKPEFKAIDNPASFADNLFTKIATHNYIYFLNALLFIWPQWLCYDWSMGCVPLIQSVLDYRIIFPFLMYLYAICTIKSICNKDNGITTKRGILFGVALIIIPFLPAANIFYPVGFVIAERILYISSAGYCLLIALGLKKIIRKSKNNYKLSIIFYVCLITSYGLKSWQRSYDWQTEYKLFINGIAVCPLNAKVHYNIAKVTDARNNTELALASYKESIRLYPDYYQAMNNLANLLKNQKKFAEAEFYLRKALKTKQDFPAAWMNLGIVLSNTERLSEAEVAYKTALRYRKNYPDCFYNLGNLYLEMNKTNDAIENWLHVVNLNRKHVLAWTNLIALLDNTDQFDKALQIIPKALTELSNSPSINFAIANIYGKIEWFQEAENHFLSAIKFFNHSVQAIHYGNLGVLYHRWKKYDMAEVMYKNALKIDPSFKSAIKNLKSLQKLKIRK